MSLNPTTKSDFFGKDNLTPFIGVVEDVNDPKQSGRVKVRCVGWHPKSKQNSSGSTEGAEDGLPTEDLPWARVGMPVTHAQQSRIGGKHGLLPGSWVFGFFLDGPEGNDPFVTNTFNFTSKATEEDLRSLPQGQDGSFSEADIPFDKMEVSPKTQPNVATRSVNEQGERGYSSTADPSGDNIHHEAKVECGDHKSAAAVRRMEEDMKEGETGNPEGQKYQVSQADGRCSTNAHARSDIQRLLRERMPSALSRVSFGDAVWNRFTGSYIDLNGLMMQMSIEISNLLKTPSNSTKSQVEVELNRKTKSTSISAIYDRDGILRIEADNKTTLAADQFHATFQTKLIDNMASIVMKMMQAINNSGSGDNGGDNADGDVGANADTDISNWEAQCITDQIISNVETITQDIINDILDTDDTDSDSGIDAIIALTGGLDAVMQFPLIDQYTKFPDLFNRMTNQSQDVLNKASSCGTSRMYDTEAGGLLSLAGQPGGSDGSGASPEDPRFDVGFGGLPTYEVFPNEVVTIPCAEATTPTLPDPGTGNDGTDGGNGGSNGDGSTGDGNGLEDIGGGDRDPVGDIDTGQATFDPEPPPFAGIGTMLPDGDGGYYPFDGYKDPRTATTPAGFGAKLQALSLPASNREAGTNFRNGIPNVVSVVEPGSRYYYNNDLEPENAFPTIFIPGYSGSPVPVVEPNSGEFVGVLTNSVSWDPLLPRVPVTPTPNDKPLGISSLDPNYNITVATLFVQNTGRGYTDPQIRIVDRKNNRENGSAVATVVDGRIVSIQITDTGSNFTLLPTIEIFDTTGYGAVLRPIMDVESVDPADSYVPPKEFVYCPSKNQLNYT